VTDHPKRSATLIWTLFLGSILVFWLGVCFGPPFMREWWSWVYQTMLDIFNVHQAE